MRRKKTHDEYVGELKIKNPTVEVVGEYVDTKTKILHHCLIHDVYWDVLPVNALKGKGCRECTKDKNRNRFVKSHEEYVYQVGKVNPNIIVVEKYINSKTPILHFCKIHNVEWKAIPSNILKGCGCNECKKEKLINSNLKSHEQYVEELLIKNPIIKVVDQYIDVKTPILHYCEKHNKYWKVRPGNVLSGKGCPNCRVEKIYYAHAKTHNDYVHELSIQNPNIEVLGEYVNANTKIMHHCLLHNVFWETMPYLVLQGCGCPECGHEKIIEKSRKPHEQYVKELEIVNPNIIVLEQYVNMKTQILHKCIIHDFEWETTPEVILQGCGCPKCKSDKLREQHLKTHEQYVEELKEVNKNIIVLGDYIGANIPILHKCLIDGNEWYAAPSNILFGFGCPRCNESKGERQIRQWLESNNITYECQKTFDDCKDIKLLPFDFYLPLNNMCVEFDGKQHYEPIDYFGGQESFEITVKHDNMKNDYCKNNGISLLRIPYFKNIEEELNNFLFI